MWLSWKASIVLAVTLALGGRLARGRRGRLAAAGDIAVEASLVAALYSIWRIVGIFTDRRVTGADRHALWLWDVERHLHIANELSAQRAILGHPLIVQAANGFYAIVHVPAVGVLLVWLFLRHRDRYARFRNALAVLTFACVVSHLVPVAPPRLVAGLGFADTGALYHQSVYGPMGTGVSDQLSAMPSVHLAWACLVALAVVKASTSRWRWAVVLHPIATMWVVAVTGNHFWLDGIAAAVLLAASVAAVDVVTALTSRRRPAAVAATGEAPALQRV